MRENARGEERKEIRWMREISDGEDDG